jgi:predicted P-loop ATPase
MITNFSMFWETGDPYAQWNVESRTQFMNGGRESKPCSVFSTNDETTAVRQEKEQERTKERKEIKETNKMKVMKNTKEEIEDTAKEIIKLEIFMEAHYDLRYNVVTDQTEYRVHGTTSPFSKVAHRVSNAMCTEARKHGVNCWDKDMRRHVESINVQSCHPMINYLSHLPAWDGVDRITQLAERVSHTGYWVRHFHTWMLAVTAQWLGVNKLHGNSVAPVIISKRQGRQKSTFCKLLLPEVLQPYYMDRLSISTTGRAEQKLAEFALINLDEIDKYSAKGMASLKNLMQMAGANINKAYQQGICELHRTASFIATSNCKNLLTDPTGSRRFICIEPEGKIDCSPIDHNQIYAQLLHELKQDTRYWYTEEEEAEIMQHNAPYNKTSVEQDVFSCIFRPARANEKNAMLLSAAELYNELCKANPPAMRGSTVNQFIKALVAMEIPKVHQMTGNKYKVVRTNEEKL